MKEEQQKSKYQGKYKRKFFYKFKNMLLIKAKWPGVVINMYKFNKEQL